MDLDFNKLLDKKIFSRQEFAIVFTPYLILGYLAFINIKQLATLNNQLSYIIVFSLTVLIFLISLVATIRRGRDLNLHPAISSILYFTPFVILYYVIPSRIENDNENSENVESVNSLATSMNEERAYSILNTEMENEAIYRGLWSKAEIISEGDKALTKTTYMKLRVESMLEIERKSKESDYEYLNERIEMIDFEIQMNENELDTLKDSLSLLEEKEEGDLNDYDKKNIEDLNKQIEKKELALVFFNTTRTAIDNDLDEIDPERIAAREKLRIKKRNRKIYISIGVIVILDVIHYYYNEYSLIGVVLEGLINWLEDL